MEDRKQRDSLRARAKGYVSLGGALHKILSETDFGYKSALVVPFVLQERLLFIYHNTITAGHFGAAKTLARLAPRFYWKNMKEDCERWVAACVECRKTKSRMDPKAGNCHSRYRSLHITGRSFMWIMWAHFRKQPVATHTYSR